MARTRVKICGIRDENAAQAAVECGADALGFVFHRASPRHIEPAEAWGIVKGLPPMVHSVGLTVNASDDEYGEIMEVCPTDYSQLHGQETVKAVRARGARVIKAVRFEAGTIGEELERWGKMEEVDAILVDGSAGGQGQTLDWAALAAVRGRAGDKPLILAGGLTPTNVGEAIRVVKPYGVDVSSGVERAGGGGIKDAALIEAFCEAVRDADANR